MKGEEQTIKSIFPDAALRAEVASRLEKGENDLLTDADIETFSNLILKGKGVRNLAGISRLKKNKLAMTSFWIIVVIFVLVIILPMLWPYSYSQQLGVAQGAKVDSSYGNLAPFTYGATEQAKIAAGEKVRRIVR